MARKNLTQKLDVLAACVSELTDHYLTFLKLQVPESEPIWERLQAISDTCVSLGELWTAEHPSDNGMTAAVDEETVK